MAEHYSYKDINNLEPVELFFLIAADKMLEHFGGYDIAAAIMIVSGQPLIPTRAKFKGAVKGTSLASLTARRHINYELKYKILPTFTGNKLSQLRFILHRNLGVFVGRTIPIVGWAIITWDIVQITRKTIETYNSIVLSEVCISNF